MQNSGQNLAASRYVLTYAGETQLIGGKRRWVLHAAPVGKERSAVRR